MRCQQFLLTFYINTKFRILFITIIKISMQADNTIKPFSICDKPDELFLSPKARETLVARTEGAADVAGVIVGGAKVQHVAFSRGEVRIEVLFESSVFCGPVAYMCRCRQLL